MLKMWLFTACIVVMVTLEPTSAWYTDIVRILEHFKGEKAFDRTWSEFRAGFGSFTHNYWRGLDEISDLSQTGQYYLRVDMQAKGNQNYYYAEYRTFRVAGASDGFRLTIGNYSGNAGDGLGSLNGMKFTTKDRDNDKRSGYNCAKQFCGGFWYNDCAWALPTGIVSGPDAGFTWLKLPGVENKQLLWIRLSLVASKLVIVQQHRNGVRFFDKTWSEFRSEFGAITGNYWIGNDRLHELTKNGDYYLWVDIISNDNLYWAEYKKFIVAGPEDGYRLTIGEYRGNAGDGLYYVDGMKFTTKDQDNDKRTTQNCADVTKGGFWYNDCAYAPLNGERHSDGTGFFWTGLGKTNKKLTFSRMTLVAFEPCSDGPCKNNGECVANGSGYTCVCAPGWTGDDCTTEYSACSSDPCQNSGTCLPDGNDFLCQCSLGFAGDLCEMTVTQCKAVAPEERINCGWGGVTNAECNERSCCYDTTYNDRPYCFYETSSCANVPFKKRADCGWEGITYAQCLGRGCCFDDEGNNPGAICYRKASDRCINVREEDRLQQGDEYIDPNRCLANGWCYDTTFKPNCFTPKESTDITIQD